MDTSNNEVVGSSEPEHFSRVQVIDGFRGFVERGITNPDDLDLNDPEVIEANRILDIWDAEQRKLVEEAENRLAAELEYNLSRSTMLVDAGFSDPDYLDEVANDWLGGNDLPDAQAAGLTEVADKIQARIDEINNRLNQI
jgi:hypothetical protein